MHANQTRPTVPDPTDAPAAVLLSLVRAGLVQPGQAVQVITDSPPPVRVARPPLRDLTLL